jgi:glutamate---cysteine ligase / carboxylate-amine ligase
MLASGAMQDASHLWWAIRPSLKYQTLELRAPDCCTRIDDTIAIAALYRSLARFLFVNPAHNAGLNVVDRAIAVENKWRAQRYGAWIWATDYTPQLYAPSPDPRSKQLFRRGH